MSLTLAISMLLKGIQRDKIYLHLEWQKLDIGHGFEWEVMSSEFIRVFLKR